MIRRNLMQKGIRLIIKSLIAAAFMLLPVSAYAYNVVDLPEQMSMADALGIFSGEEITRATISNVEDGRYFELTSNEINDFYYAACEMTVYRTENPTPFRGTAINLYTETDVMSYYVGSGVQIGLYGSDNYICYKAAGEDEVFLTYLDTMYKDREDCANGEEIHRRTSNDFLKLPDAAWAQDGIREAASKNLLPYQLTGKYSANISREEFCILIGRLITVTSGCADLEAYIRDKGEVYLLNSFSDCAGKDTSIDMLYALGIVNGRGDGTFDPDGTLSREEAAKMLTTAAEQFVMIHTDRELSYADRSDISRWAYYSVQWVTDNGIMTGMDDNRFNPGSYYTVEQAIVTAGRLFNYLDERLV